MDKPKAVIVVSDLHCGSIYGLHPDSFMASDDRHVGQNIVQKYLWTCWKHFWGAVEGFPVAAVIVNGDLIDGSQAKSQGAESVMSKISDQRRSAGEVLKYGWEKVTRKNKQAKLYMVAGTDYHTGKISQDEESIVPLLPFENYKGFGPGVGVREVLNLEIDGVMLNLAHHISASTVNRAGAVERELLGSMLAELSGYPKCDLVVRSHVHTFRGVQIGYQHGITTPCWQLQTKYMRKFGAFKMVPDIGGVIVWVDGKAKRAGSDPIVVQPVLYSLPKVQVVKL